MKKIFALLPFIAAFALAGCGDKEGENKEGGSLPHTKQEVQENMEELKNDGGYEVSFRISGDTTSPMEITLGTKDRFSWAYTAEMKIMVEDKEDNKVQAYTFEEESQKFVAVGTPVDSGSTMDYTSKMWEGYSNIFLSPYDDLALATYTKTKETTYIGRKATEYKVSQSYEDASIEGKIIIDKETGAALFWEYTGTAGGESGSGKFEVLTFKVGADVSVPAIKTAE